MNKVFVALVAVAVVVAFCRDVFVSDDVEVSVFGTARADLVGGKEASPTPPSMPTMKALTEKTLDAATSAASLALGLVGALALWSGLMRVAEKAGLVALLSRLLRPLLVRLFPEVPADHPAMGAIVMNMAANLLGLGNAATPLGLQAMKHLQELNLSTAKKTATNAMVMFLALNTTHLTLIPARTIFLRQQNGSLTATNIVLPTILATACGMVVAVVLARALARFFPPDASTSQANSSSSNSSEPA